MKAIILAAGYATRLYPLTQNFPKALLPIADKPIINYLLDELETLPELNQVHVVSNHRFIGHFESWLSELNQAKRYERLHIQVWDDGTSSDETKLGAVGDIQFVIDQAKLDDELLVAAADNFFTFPLIQFYNDFKSHQCDTLCAARMTDLNSLRRMAVATLDENRKVLNLEEKPEHPKSDIAVYALYLYRRDTLPLIRTYLAEGNSPDAPGHLPEWLYHRREVRAFLFEGECIDIGTPESYRETCRRFQKP